MQSEKRIDCLFGFYFGQVIGLDLKVLTGEMGQWLMVSGNGCETEAEAVDDLRFVGRQSSTHCGSQGCPIS